MRGALAGEAAVSGARLGGRTSGLGCGGVRHWSTGLGGDGVALLGQIVAVGVATTLVADGGGLTA